MKRQLERYGKWLFAIGFLAAVAILLGGYILVQQRISNPFEDKLTVYAELRTTNGLTPGLSQPVNVAGVRVGTIAGAELHDGLSRVRLKINRGKLKHVYDNARATLVPNTALKDMQIELVPGDRSAPEMDGGETIPVARTAPPIDADELTAALDSDTRDFFGMLVSGADRGTKGRGKDLRTLLKALEPTAKQLRPVSSVLAARRTELKRLVSNLGLLSRAVGRRDTQLSSLVTNANDTLGALASEQTALGGSVARLPGTLNAAQRSLDKATAFADKLGPTLTALRPTARKAPDTLKALGPFVRGGEPDIRRRLRPLVREIQPLGRNLAPTAKNLNAATPALTNAFRTLNYVVNETGYNAPGDDEGYLFWLAWLAHNGASVLSTQDANGSTFRGMILADCKSLLEQPQFSPLVKAVIGPFNAC